MTERDKKHINLTIEYWGKLTNLHTLYQKRGGRIGEGCYGEYLDRRNKIIKEYHEKLEKIMKEP